MPATCFSSATPFLQKRLPHFLAKHFIMIFLSASPLLVWGAGHPGIARPDESNTFNEQIHRPDTRSPDYGHDSPFAVRRHCRVASCPSQPHPLEKSYGTLPIRDEMTVMMVEAYSPFPLFS